METVFPTDVGYQSLFLVGYRKNPANAAEIQRVGTVVVKRSYDVSPNPDPALGALIPRADASPVFVKDEVDSGSGKLRYEHDLATYKPSTDVIVLGFSLAVAATVDVANQPWLRRTVVAGETDLFGWNARDETVRNGEGSFPSDVAAYPLAAPLPAGFRNIYFNGYRRDSAQLTPLPVADPRATIRIARGSTSYGFRLGDEPVRARYLYYRGTGPDNSCAWRSHAVDAQLDTIVVEPDVDRCYVVWRSVWPFDEPSGGPGVYRRLIVEAD